MSAEALTPVVSERICKHMNEDHADALVLYAKAYAGVSANKAQMIAIDPQGMDLSAEVNGEKVPVRIKFEQKLASAEDAHQVLIAMLKQARTSK